MTRMINVTVHPRPVERQMTVTGVAVLADTNIEATDVEATDVEAAVEAYEQRHDEQAVAYLVGFLMDLATRQADQSTWGVDPVAVAVSEASGTIVNAQGANVSWTIES